MSASIEMIEFERREAYLSELEDGPPYTVHGVALGADDVTVGQSGIKKLWPAEELREAADTLEGKNLVVDHQNSSAGVVGKVTKAGYKEEVGILYEAELHDEELAEKIEAGLLEVSVRGYHDDVTELEEDEETGAKIVENIQFQNLSIVPTGAAPSNSIEMGEAAELSAGQIQVYAASLQEDDEDEEEDDEPEFQPSDTVQWGNDQHGIVLEIDEDEEEAVVDVYEQDEDGTWRSTGEETTVSFSALSEWDVDMSDIGTMMDEEDEEENSESEEDEDNSVEELDYSTYSVHKPDFDGTTESDWNKPNKSDFDTDDLSEIGTHFIAVQGDFPADNYGDLALPVVEPNGDLNLNALQTVRGGRGVTALDPEPSDEMVEDVFSMTANLANNNFDKDWPKDPEEASGEGEESRVGHEITHEHIKEWSPARYPEGSDEVIEDLEAFLDEHDEASLDDFTEWTDTDATETVEVFRESIEADEPTADDLHTWMVEHLAERDEKMDDSSPETADADGDDEEAVADTEDDESDEDDEESSDDDGLAKRPAPVMVLTGDDFRRRYKSGESEKDSTTTIEINTTMNEEIEQKLEELDEPVAVEKESLDELQDKADQFEEMNSSLEDLRERTEVLDEVDREQVEELAESEEPVVLESSRYEQLTAEAEQVKNVYAAALADEMPAFDADELTDRFSIEELREKYEEQIGDPEEELAADPDPEPRSEDPSEEELEGEEPSEEEKEAEQKQAELREKILGDD